MSAIPKSIAVQNDLDGSTNTVNQTFLKYLPAVDRHAAFRFRRMRRADRDEAVAEARAAAFQTVVKAVRAGNASRLTPSSVARYAVLHVRGGRHVGGRQDSKKDVMSPLAQRRGGFRVLGLAWDSALAYDCLRDTDCPTWGDHLLEDRRTHVADQAAFRIDWSRFLAGQSDRTRRTLAMLAAGHEQIDVAEALGVTPGAVCQRLRRAEREWRRLQQLPARPTRPYRKGGPTTEPQRASA